MLGLLRTPCPSASDRGGEHLEDTVGTVTLLSPRSCPPYSSPMEVGLHRQQVHRAFSIEAPFLQADNFWTTGPHGYEADRDSYWSWRQRALPHKCPQGISALFLRRFSSHNEELDRKCYKAQCRACTEPDPLLLSWLREASSHCSAIRRLDWLPDYQGS